MAVSLSNPFRRIVGVGWPSVYLAFQMNLTNETKTGAADDCSPHVADEGDPPYNEGFYGHYITGTEMEITTGNTFKFNKAAATWSVVEGASVENAPSAPFIKSFAPRTVANIYNEPHRFALSGGAVIPDIPIPSLPGERFLDSTDLGFEVLGRTLDPANTACIRIAGFPVSNLLMMAETSENGAVEAATSIGLSDVVLRRRGKAYTPIGAYLVPDTKGPNPTVEISAPVRAWVLCERNKAAD